MPGSLAVPDSSTAVADKWEGKGVSFRVRGNGMRNLVVRFAGFSMLLALSSVAAFAQSSAYHLAFSEGTSGWVIVTNDSQKPIEAFSVKATCGAVSATPAYDALEFGGGGMSHPAVKGLQPAVIQPGQRFFALVNLAPQASGCAWQGHVQGVIYADGTYDGEESAVRELQARRAGIAAALQYWTNVELGAHEQTVAAVGAANAEVLAQDDLAKTWSHTCPDQPAVCAYWSGRRQVDENVAQGMKRNGQLGNYLDRWTAKIDADVAFRTLEPIFPSPSAERDAATRTSNAR